MLGRLAQTPVQRLFTSATTVGELFFGAHRLGGRAKLLQALDETIRDQFDAVLPYDEAAAREYGRVRSDLERNGTPIGDADTQIAAIALAHGLTVVTGNVRHFGEIPGLRVENWLA
jgi:predicted nucleic acid-binding protein